MCNKNVQESCSWMIHGVQEKLCNALQWAGKVQQMCTPCNFELRAQPECIKRGSCTLLRGKLKGDLL